MQVNKFLSDLLIKDPGLNMPAIGDGPALSPRSTSIGPKPSVVVNLSASALQRAGEVGAANPSSLTVAKFLATRNSLTVANIVDSAANIAKNLNALNAAASLAKIGTVSQLGTPVELAITYNQWLTDTDVGDGSILDKLGIGRNNVRVNGVDDSNLSTVMADAKVVKVGVVGVAITDLSARLSDLKISTIGVTGLSQADLSSDAYVSNLRNVKVTSIGVLDVPNASLNAVLSNSKVKTVTVTDVPAKQVGSVGARSQVTSMTVSDTSASIASNFNTLILRQNKISSVTQNTPTAVMNLTGAQFRIGTNLLAKIDSGAYSVNLKNVLANDASQFAANAKVLDIKLVDSGLNIGRNFNVMGDAKITQITQNSLKSTISISAEQYSEGSAVFLKMTPGKYSLAITNGTFTNPTDLAALTNIPEVKTVSLAGLAVSDLVSALVVSPKVTAVKISDTAAAVTGSLELLKSYILRIGQIGNSESPSGTRPNIVFTPSTYNSKLADKLSGFSTVVDYDNVAHTNNSNLYSVTTDSKGARTIARDGVRQTYTNNVNFFKFSDKNLFGTTGNKNVDAVLYGGTKYWWYDTAAASTSETQINGAMNALSAPSSRHALTFSFLNSASIAEASNSPNDSKGFVEMSANQKAAVKKALDYIATVTNLTFTEASSSGQGDLNFGTNNQGTVSGAYANLPNSAASINLMLNNTGSSGQANNNFTQGGYGWQTLIHEIAHSLGLKHPGNYNAGGGGTVGPYLPAGDAGTSRYTIMSYKRPLDGQNVTATPIGNGISYSFEALSPKTLMTYDIAALQFLYGVNTDASGVNNLQNTRTETASASFQALASGQTVTMAGLTFTAGSSGITANELATAFSGITSSDTLGSINLRKTTVSLIPDTKGVFTGAPSGWTSGTASANTVVFTSTTTLTNVQNLVSTGTVSKLPTISTIDGAGKKSASVAFNALAANQSVSLGNLTFTAGDLGASANDVAYAFQNLATGAAPTTLTARNEIATATFGSGTLTAGQTVTLNGLTWTAGTGGTSQANLEKVFGSLPLGTTRDDANTAAAAAIVSYNAALHGSFTAGTATISTASAALSHVITFTATSKNVDDLVASGTNSSLTITTAVTQQGSSGGTYTGTLTGWNTGAANNNTVNFTVQNLTSTGTVNKQPVITVTDSVGKESATAVFKALATTETVTLGGLTFTAGASGASANDVAYAFQNLATGAAPTNLVASDETATATFVGTTNLSAGKAITLNGLTWTAGSAGISASDLASAFASIAAGTVHNNVAITGNANIAALLAANKGSFTAGTSIAGSGAAATVGGNQVVTFTATNSNVTDLTAALSATPGTITVTTATTQQGSSGGTYTGTFTGWNTGVATNDTLDFVSTTAYADVQDLASTASTIPTITATNGAARTATASVVFKDLDSGETVTMAGVTFTAGANGATKNEVAKAFSGLAAGATAAQQNTLHSLAPTKYGEFTGGPAAGWVSGIATAGTVVFTSTSAYASGQTLASTGTVGKQPVITVNDGAVRTEAASVVFKALAANQSVSLGGLTFTSTSGSTADEVAGAFANLTSGVSATALTPAREVSTITFSAMTAGQSITVAGLTYTSTGATTGDEVASYFTTVGGFGVAKATPKGVLTGEYDGWGSAVASSGATLVVTSTTPTGDVANIEITATGAPATLATAVTVDGVSSGGAYTGTFTGWNTGAATGATVNFTSATAYADVQDLASTASNSPSITKTDGVNLSIDSYQTTTFTSGWRGFESLYIPETQDDEVLDLSTLTNKNIVDLRAGAFSSINILPPETKTDLPTSIMRRAQTYMGLNNVALAYGTEVNAVKGGNSADSYFVSDYNVSINDSSGSNQVFLNGTESDWLSSTIRSAETSLAAFKPLSSGQTVTMAGLTFTAGTAGIDANELATAFSGITASDSLEAINARNVTAGILDTKGVFTGTPSGWTSGTASTNTVVFTSRTPSSNVPNLVSSGTGAQPTIANTDGAARIYINTLTGQSVELIGNFTIRYYDAEKQAVTHSNLDLMV